MNPIIWTAAAAAMAGYLIGVAVGCYLARRFRASADVVTLSEAYRLRASMERLRVLIDSTGGPDEPQAAAADPQAAVTEPAGEAMQCSRCPAYLVAVESRRTGLCHGCRWPSPPAVRVDAPPSYTTKPGE